MDTLCLKPGIPSITPSISSSGVVIRSSSVQPPSNHKNTSWGFSLRSLWPTGGRHKKYDAVSVSDAVLVSDKEENKKHVEGQNGNWVLQILHVRSLWKRDDRNDGDDSIEGNDGVGEEHGKVGEDHGGCEVGEEMEFDRDSFSKLLKRVSLAEARLYAQMSYLGNLAYAIPQIKPANLLKKHGLRFVTSSLEKKEQRLKAEKEKVLAEDEKTEENPEEKVGPAEEKMMGKRISASAAYQIAASAASYLHSYTKTVIPFKSSRTAGENDNVSRGEGNIEKFEMTNADVASLRATTDSVTAVVAAKEEVKQAVADDLNSIRSSPCEWFICDDDQNATRFFVIQGSETMASWQANLLFEPIQFEGLDVLVHRGIYEAAKGIYEQMLPEVQTHLNRHGDRASFRFTGHSLGGSLSLLVNLMLLIRGEVSPSSLLPVITFGAPSIMCGGDYLLRKLGLPRNHLQAITMHRDIVPRAFSCNYPNHVAELLKAVNGNFRNYPCLSNQSLLYAPMGEFLILQPDEKLSPNHELLPSGTGLYLLARPISAADDVDKQVRAARTVFLNTPHPLEILSDRSAYGSDGTIHRDHDMNSYWRSVRNVIRHELNLVRRTRREHRRRAWWPLVAPRGVHAGVVVGKSTQGQLNFLGVIQSGKESIKRFSRFVASQHMHLVVVFLLPARVLIFGVSRVMSFH